LNSSFEGRLVAQSGEAACSTRSSTWQQWADPLLEGMG